MSRSCRAWRTSSGRIYRDGGKATYLRVIGILITQSGWCRTSSKKAPRPPASKSEFIPICCATRLRLYCSIQVRFRLIRCRNFWGTFSFRQHKFTLKPVSARWAKTISARSAAPRHSAVFINTRVIPPTEPTLPSVRESQDHLPNDIAEDTLRKYFLQQSLSYSDLSISSLSSKNLP